MISNTSLISKFSNYRRFCSLTSTPTKMFDCGLLNMPLDLVFVRHGAAEGNLAYREARAGNNSRFTAKFMSTHESRWRLTPEGCLQAQIAGEWIRNNITQKFGLYLTSEYVRALETAAHLHLPGAHWARNIFLREKKFGSSIQMRKRDPFYWHPPSGESLADVALRVDHILESLSEIEIDPSAVIIVTHYNVIQIFSARIEMIPQIDFQTYMKKKENVFRNACVLHYTRKNPKSGQISPVYKWRRLASPWKDGNSVHPPWQEIPYLLMSNQDLENNIKNFEPQPPI